MAPMWQNPRAPPPDSTSPTERPGEAPRDRGDVLATALARADAVGRARLERVEQPIRRRVARPAEQDHVGGGRQRLMEACRRPGGRVVGDDEQHPIGLPHAASPHSPSEPSRPADTTTC